MTKSPSLLVVEDHQETRTFLVLALSDDYTIDTASDAHEALKKVEQTQYDLILIDIALGDTMDGTDLVKKFRQKPAYADTPMIAMTAHQLRENRIYFLRQGFDEFLGKPFYPEALIEAIEHLLTHGRPSDDTLAP